MSALPPEADMGLTFSMLLCANRRHYTLGCYEKGRH